MYRTIYSVLLIISTIIMLVDFVFLTKIFLKMEYESMSRPEHSALVESYKEGYRYVVKDAYERKLIFFEEEPIKCGAAWLANAGDKVKYIDYWNSKDSLNKEPKYSSDLFSMVFDFIDEKSEKPYSIEELLKS